MPKAKELPSPSFPSLNQPQELKRRDSSLDIAKWKIETAATDLAQERARRASELEAQKARAAQALATAAAEAQVGAPGLGRRASGTSTH